MSNDRISLDIGVLFMTFMKHQYLACQSRGERINEQFQVQPQCLSLNLFHMDLRIIRN